MSMDVRTKWLWTITLANVATAILLILAIYGVTLALAVIAPEISSWPLFVSLAIGVALSVVGLKLAAKVTSPSSRRIGYLVNGSALTLNIFIICGIAALFIGSTKERFIVPSGYKGDVYIIYNRVDGEPVSGTRWAVTYRIPPDGILRTRAPMLRRWTRTECYYQLQSGTLERIRNSWPSTIHPTQENLANDKDMGVYFPRTGRFTDSAECSVEYEQFYVGTKAHLLTKYHETNLARYLHSLPGGCIGQSR